MCSGSVQASVYMYIKVGAEIPRIGVIVCTRGFGHPNEVFRPVFHIALHSCPVGAERKKGLGYKSRIISLLAPLPHPSAFFLTVYTRLQSVQQHSFGYYTRHYIPHIHIILNTIKMARFNLSFLAVFLVLAAFAMSMPTKRDQSQGLGLDTALSDLRVSVQNP